MHNKVAFDILYISDKIVLVLEYLRICCYKVHLMNLYLWGDCENYGDL